MPPTTAQILSIHDHRGASLAFDLKDVLRAVEEYGSRWVWCMTLLDAVGGENVQAACRAVEASGDDGVWLSWQELNGLAAQIEQTIEGEWIAFPQEERGHQLVAEDLDL